MNKKILAVAVMAAVLSACGGAPKKETVVIEDLGNDSGKLKDALAQQQAQIESRDQQIADLKRELASQGASSEQQSAASGDLLPPNAKAGECYARVFIAPTYKTENVTVLAKEASEIVKVIPATYGWETKQVTVREASEVVEVTPAVYGWRMEKVQVSPPITELREVPPVYSTVKEKVLVKPATTEWKKGDYGKGVISSKLDASTGEIMCLVEVPAVYKTVSKRVMTTPATTKEVVVQPAQFRNVKTRYEKVPAKTVTRKIPAQYTTVKVKKLLTPAKTQRTPVPAKYTTVAKRSKVNEGYIKWAPIVCETNATRDVIRNIQGALKQRGYYKGPLDGIIGSGTSSAVKKFQQKTGLATGGITIETVNALGVKI